MNVLLLVFLAIAHPNPKTVFVSVLKSEHQSEVTPQKVCAIQHAIKLKRTVPWSQRECEEIASDFTKAKERGVPPVLPFAMSINESDLRADRSSIAIYKTYPFYFKGKKKLKVQDHGLMGVRCVEDNGKCINGPAIGLTPKELKRPSTNIRIGVSIMLRKKQQSSSAHFWDSKFLLRYNGNTSNRDNGYADRIMAITAAINGTLVPVQTPRMEKLVLQIVSAVKELESDSKGAVASR